MLEKKQMKEKNKCTKFRQNSPINSSKKNLLIKISQVDFYPTFGAMLFSVKPRYFG